MHLKSDEMLRLWQEKYARNYLRLAGRKNIGIGIGK
jgi:hypothetical protein